MVVDESSFGGLQGVAHIDQPPSKGAEEKAETKGENVTFILNMFGVEGDQDKLEEEAKGSMATTLKQAGITNFTIYTQKEYKALPRLTKIGLWLSSIFGGNVWYSYSITLRHKGGSFSGHKIMVDKNTLNRSSTPAHYFANATLHEAFHQITGNYLMDAWVVAQRDIESGWRQGLCGERGTIMGPKMAENVNTLYFSYPDAQELKEKLGY